MKRTMLLAVAVLILVNNALAEPSKEQPRIPNAYYGRDGFWHCEEGYTPGESGGCEEIAAWKHSAYTRLRHFELYESSDDGDEAR